MNIPLDHECFNWEWRISELSTESFVFSIEEGKLGYRLGGREFTWWDDVDTIERGMREWIRYKPRTLFCGPMQPPPSKVVLKIRQMEQRQTWQRNLA